MALYDKIFKVRRLKSYDSKKTVMDDRKNLGNEYRNNILTNSLSKYILRNNTVNDFVVMIQHVFADLIDSVTYLKTYKSFTIRKGDKKVK